jgi:hypothetical protein
MPHKKKNKEFDEEFQDPKPLNFDEDEKKGVSDHLKNPFMSASDLRGDNQETQYYQEEEAMSPEEVKQRKKDGTI